MIFMSVRPIPRDGGVGPREPDSVSTGPCAGRVVPVRPSAPRHHAGESPRARRDLISPGG